MRLSRLYPGLSRIRDWDDYYVNYSWAGVYGTTCALAFADSERRERVVAVRNSNEGLAKIVVGWSFLCERRPPWRPSCHREGRPVEAEATP